MIGVNARSVHIGLVVGKLTLRQVFLPVLLLFTAASLTFHQCLTLIHSFIHSFIHRQWNKMSVTDIIK